MSSVASNPASKYIVVNGNQVHIRGWKADRPDHRDKIYVPTLKLKQLAPVLSLRPQCAPILDQGQLGSCTMNSSTSAVEFLDKKLGKPVILYSRLFGYYAERVGIEHTDPHEDSGAQIRDAMAALATYGVCYETTWPYYVERFGTNPPHNAWGEAWHHKILSYHSVTGLDGVKACIAEGYPVVFGFSVPANMESAECAQTGVVNYPTPNEQIVGGHAVLAVGYDDVKQQIQFQNSWGTSWGDGGFGYLGYQFFTTGLASDYWTVRSDK